MTPGHSALRHTPPSTSFPCLVAYRVPQTMQFRWNFYEYSRGKLRPLLSQVCESRASKTLYPKTRQLCYSRIIPHNWASEASPTLGCSIEISRDIYMSVCRMSVVCQINCVGGITWPTRMLKVFWGRLIKPVTPVSLPIR